MDGRKFFQALLDSKQMNPHALAQKLKSPTLQSTLQRFLDGKTKEARRSTFEPVAKFFRVSLDGFYNEEIAAQEVKRLHLASGELAANSAVKPTVGSKLAKNEEVIHVPLLANAGSMGMGNDVLHDDVLVGQIALSSQWVTKRIQPTSPIALRFIHAYGDSMAPTFADGDVLLVDTGARDPSCADGVYVLATNQRLFIKRVTGRFDGGYDVTSDNPTVKTVGSLNGDHGVDVLGRVVWAWNGTKL